jgi:hypothetical protein
MTNLESIAFGFAKDRMDLIEAQLPRLTNEPRGMQARIRARWVRRNINECRDQLEALGALIRLIEEENA